MKYGDPFPVAGLFSARPRQNAYCEGVPLTASKSSLSEPYSPPARSPWHTEHIESAEVDEPLSPACAPRVRVGSAKP